MAKLVLGQGQCGTGSNQNSDCRNAFINSLTDFCLFAPPSPGADSTIGDTEKIEVAWCMRSGTGARLIPNGTITSAHFVQTPDFVQITGIGRLTMLNIPLGDSGGELDPHGADGNGNPVGGLVFSSAFGQLEQIQEWTNFMSDSEFCFRACKPGPKAPTFCQHIYDVMGCQWNMPGNYDGGFDQCAADSGEPMGVYGTSTFFQGQPATPLAHPVPASSLCTATNTIGNGLPGLIVSSTIPPVPIPSSTTLTDNTTPTSSPAAMSKTTSGSSGSSSIPTTSLQIPTTPGSSTSSTLTLATSTSISVTSSTGAATSISPTATNTTVSAAFPAVGRWNKFILMGGAAAVGFTLAGVFRVFV
ncbi:hypothetical protein HYPSUDRAFT_199615 [Hypholoma sublateritium FD-334 SS-4]|uniref:Carbohydrate-binding module family 13 protein n=1 Tax=Hypholoma sublateritium (strain FD-334 SS-4) TaxID=945553 RepID=A0A0D2P9Z4_HYPSF|nr:hypothetical protein HYPSUDRAFT_199615 [Hypholoma sublateritium FD-334 SS-4]